MLWAGKSLDRFQVLYRGWRTIAPIMCGHGAGAWATGGSPRDLPSMAKSKIWHHSPRKHPPRSTELPSLKSLKISFFLSPTAIVFYHTEMGDKQSRLAGNGTHNSHNTHTDSHHTDNSVTWNNSPQYAAMTAGSNRTITHTFVRSGDASHKITWNFWNTNAAGSNDVLHGEGEVPSDAQLLVEGIICILVILTVGLAITHFYCARIKQQR